MNKESKLNLNAGDYAISHCDSDKTYNGLEVHRMLCDAYIAGSNDTLEDDDERIKNSLINFIKMSSEVGGLALHKWEADEMLAWLEKQKDCIKLSDSAYTSNRDIIEFADKYSHAVWEKLMDKFKKNENYSIGCNDVSDIVLNAIINTYNWLEKQDKQKPVISDDALREGIAHFGITQYQIDNWLKKYVDVEKQGEQESEDKVEPHPTEDRYMEGYLNGINDASKTLKSAAWSEEDERLCQCLIEDQKEALDKVRNNKYGHSEIISDLKEMYHERIDWLKSLKGRLKPQNRWKPSDEQMSLLQAIINEPNNAASESCQIVLKDILEQLKKLKEG